MKAEHRFDDEWLAALLLDNHLISSETLALLRSGGKKSLAQEAVSQGKATEEAILGVVQRTYGIRCFHSNDTLADKPPVHLLPEQASRRLNLLPIAESESQMDVLTSNPLASAHLEDAHAISSRTPVPIYSLPKTIEALIDAAYSRDAQVLDLINKLGESDPLELVIPEGEEPVTTPDELSGPVVQFVNALIVRAARLGASDIHIEQDERFTAVRFRIDGDMQEIMRLPPAVGKGPVVARLKIMAGLDIADHMRAKDGRLRLLHSGRELTARLSFLPTTFGEDVVMRLVDKAASIASFERLGLSAPTAAIFERLARRAQGMTVFTGPTGSGKSSSAYAAVNLVKSQATKTVSVEDPVEQRLSGAAQVQVNEKLGLGFSEALRSILRQDPDIVLVGEMRDAKTAEIAFQAAVTGHLVFSTLHTNDALSSIVRLLGLGVERFQIASGLSGVFSQRLVRKLCMKCRRPASPEDIPPAIREALQSRGLQRELHVPVGCDACAYSGYKGRVAIAEVLELTPALGDMINEGAAIGEIRSLALRTKALRSMTDDGLWHIAKGNTTVDEVAFFTNLGPKEERLSSEAHDGPRVIVIDDDETCRSLAKASLEGAQMRAIAFKDGLEGLQEIGKTRADLILLDLEMPVLDGLSFLRVLRGTMGHLSTKVIVLTSDDSDQSRALCYQAGCNDYLVKPLSPGKLIERVKSVLER